MIQDCRLYKNEQTVALVIGDKWQEIVYRD